MTMVMIMADDLISRQAAIDLFPNDALEWDTKDGYVAPHIVRRMIEELPSADAEPVIHGKWLTAYGEHISFGVRPHVSFCSACNEVTAFKYRYCPNCGARMRGYDNG